MGSKFTDSPAFRDFGAKSVKNFSFWRIRACANPGGGFVDSAVIWLSNQTLKVKQN